LSRAGPGAEAARHADQDKIYLVLEGFALVVVDGKEERLEAGERSWPGPARNTASETPPGRLLAAVVVTPPTTARLMARPVRASLMITCLGDMFFPEVGVKIVPLLRRLGVTVEFPAGQTCCGCRSHSGYHDSRRV